MGVSGVEGGRRGFNPGSSGGDTAHAEMSLVLGQWNLGPALRLREFAPVTGDFCDAYGRERRAGVVSLLQRLLRGGRRRTIWPP